MEKKIEILAILNKYKNAFENFINSSNIELLDILKLVDKKLHNNMSGSEDPPTKFKLDKNLLDKL